MDSNTIHDESSAPVNGFHRLVLFNWNNGLLAILGGLTVSFFLFGYWYPYWRITDVDVFHIYNVLLMNAGIPQEMAHHPAYLTLLMLCGIFRFLHKIGWMEAYSLTTLPPVSDAAAYNLAWTQLVQTARLLCLVTALTFVVAFAYLMRRLVRDWYIATVCTFALAFSGGIAMSARSVKSELLAAALVTCALLVVLIVATAPRMKWRPLLIGLAALMCTLALENKVQAIFVIAAFPVIALPFGIRSDDPHNFWRQPRGYGALAAFVLVALLATIAAAPLLLEGMFPDPAVLGSLRPVLGAFGVFQAVFAAWIGLGIFVYAIVWRIPVVEAVAAAFAIIGGCALALLTLNIIHNTGNVLAVVNPIDQLFMFAGHSTTQLFSCHSLVCNTLLRLLLDNLSIMLKNHTFFLLTSPRPAIFLEWFVIAATIFAVRCGKRQVALQAAVLLVSVWGIDTLQAARGLKQEYFNFTDPLIIIAAAVLLAEVVELQYHRWAYPIGAALIVLHGAFSQAEPIKHSMMRSGAESKCSILTLKQLDTFPFCRN